jgi:cysteinyl-tRNA synthetase
MGYPGWHIECSAMSMRYLGEEFDIHTGGVDHIPVHHENELAQTEAVTGKTAVHYWLHGEFLLVDNGKMSKSLGNTYTVSDLKERGINPLAFRYLCLNANYRSKLNFTWDVIKSAQVALERLLEGALAHKGGKEPVEASVVEGHRKEFEEAIYDDLNIPKAMSVVWNIVRRSEKSDELYRLLLEMDEILGLNISSYDGKPENVADEELDEEIEALIEKRQQARKEKNWKLADEIRDSLRERGILLEDGPDGVRWKKVK